MRYPLRLALGAVTAIAAAAAGVSGASIAGAAGGAPYSLEASGLAFKMSIAGTSLVGGTSSASAGSSVAAQAQGAGEATPTATGSQQATAGDPGTSQTLPHTCAQPAVPFPAPLGSLVGLGAGCSAASASEDASGLPTATATGQVTTASVQASATALPVPVTPKGTVASTLGGILGTLPSLPTTGLPLGTVLLALAAAANVTLTTLVQADVGSSTSSVSASATTGSAKAVAGGGTIGVLDGLGAGGGPLLSITVGQASVTLSLDRTTGEVTANDTPAAVTVVLDSPVTGRQTFPLAPGASQTFLGGTPLATTVAVGSGSATSGNGAGSASADGVTLDLLQGLGATTATGANGGIEIGLASVTAGISATAPVTAAATTPPATTPPAATSSPPPAPAPSAPQAPASGVVTGATTVHTGEPWSGPLSLVLLGLMMCAGLALVFRRRLASAVHRAADLAPGVSSPTGGRPSGPVPGTSSVPPPVPGPARRQSHTGGGPA